MQSQMKTVHLGLTVKFLIEVDEATAEAIHRAGPDKVRVADEPLLSSGLRIAVGERLVAPTRVWMHLEEVQAERIEDYMEE